MITRPLREYTSCATITYNNDHILTPTLQGSRSAKHKRMAHLSLISGRTFGEKKAEEGLAASGEGSRWSGDVALGLTFMA